MSNFEQIIQKLFFQTFKDLLNLGKIESFDFIFKICQDETGIKKEHLSHPFFETLHTRYLDITEGKFLIPHLHKEVEEIILHGNLIVEIISNNKREFLAINLSSDDFGLYLVTLCVKNKVEWNQNLPFASFYSYLFNYDLRISLFHGSLSDLRSPKAFFRVLSKKNIPFQSFFEEEINLNWEELINNGQNILICGATGSGKTTFLSTLCQKIPKEEHVIVMEDTKEIGLGGDNWTRMISDEKKDGKKMLDLCAYSLRMRPDRIILGEMRSEEVVSFLLSLNSGHQGCMATIHAINAPEALSRLSLLFELYSSKGTMSEKKVMEIVCRNINYVVYLKNKKVKEIIKVIGTDGQRPYYEEIYNQKEKSTF